MPKDTSSRNTRHSSVPSDVGDTPASVLSQDDAATSASPAAAGSIDPKTGKTAEDIKKRKNADAQAAFRQRRANYIANLEETVTTLEGAVRRLQDALRDARDEMQAHKDEKQRLIHVLEANGIDWRQHVSLSDPSSSGDPSGSAAAAGGLDPSQQYLKLPDASSSSLHGSSSHGPEFVLSYVTGSLDPSTGVPQQQSSQQGQASMVDNNFPSPYYPNSGAPSPSDYLNQSGPRQPQHDYGIMRPGSSASSNSSRNSVHSGHSFGDQEPMGTGGAIGYNDMNLFSAMTLEGGSSPGAAQNQWQQQQQQQQSRVDQSGYHHQQSHEHEGELGRSDTVKAAHRRTHSDNPAGTSPSQLQTMSQPQPSFNQYDYGIQPQGLAGDFSGGPQQHSRSSSSSSLFSNEGNVGHPYMAEFESEGAYSYSSDDLAGEFDLEMATIDPSSTLGGDPSSMFLAAHGQNPANPGAFLNPGSVDMNLLASSGSANAGTSPSVLQGSGGFAVPGVPAGIGLVDHGNMGGSAMLGQVPGMGGPSASGISGVVGGGGGGVGPGGGPMLPNQQVPMSNTLATIKMHAFGTSRKARTATRSKRPGADSAAKVAIEALQARGTGLGLDVDLVDEGDDDIGGADASVTRRHSTVKRKKQEEPQVEKPPS